jgi:hypothetical protein
MSLKIYLPEPIALRLHDRLNDIKPSKNAIKSLDDELVPLNYKIEKFYQLLAILSNPKGNGYKKKNYNGFKYVPLSSKHLVKIIGNDYASYLRYLLNQGFIMSKNDNLYNKCRYFHLYDSNMNYSTNNSDLFYSYINKVNTNKNSPINIKIVSNSKKGKAPSTIEVTLSKKSVLFNKKKRKYDLQTDRKKKLPEHIRKQMWNHYKEKMVLDTEKAEKYCLKEYMFGLELMKIGLDTKYINNYQFIKEKSTIENQYHNRISSINNLRNPKKNKSWLFSRKGINRRLNTNLTMMASDLRQFIIGYDKMSYLDLSNSQPVLFNVELQLLKETASSELKTEINQYFYITIRGKWYEELSKIFDCNRETAKKNWMLIAYSKNGDCLSLKKKFKNKFPEIFKIIEQRKENDYTKFAINLQKIESYIFIDVICKRLVEKNIMPLSIHDGFLVDEEDTELAYKIMSKALSEYIGAVPVIDINGVKRYS